jgi:HPt (histidine-containing phosphotransfer) domain-containing protein
MATQSVTLDVNEALLRLNGNRPLFMRLLSRFLELNRNVEENARKAMASGNREEIMIFFHSLKGGAGNLSAKKIANKASELEMIAKEGDIEIIKEELQAFLSLFPELQAAFDDLNAS